MSLPKGPRVHFLPFVKSILEDLSAREGDSLILDSQAKEKPFFHLS